MMCLAFMTGLAAFLGVRFALRHHFHHGWRRHGMGGCGGYGQHDRWGGYDGEEYERGRHWGGGGPMVFLRGVLHRIGARPEQEETIRAAVDELKDTASSLRGEGRRTREEIADAFRKPGFDEVAMGELFARHDGAIERLRKALVGTLAKTHDALDEKQRHRLADLIAAGPRAFRGFGW